MPASTFSQQQKQYKNKVLNKTVKNFFFLPSLGRFLLVNRQGADEEHHADSNAPRAT